MANPSLQIGNDNWAIKEDNLLGYSTAGTRFVPQPITMTRATLGTRVNPSGLVEDVELLGSELVTNGDFDTDSDWTKVNSTISSGKATVTVVGGANSYITQTLSYTSGQKYKLTATINGTSGKEIKFQDRGNNSGGLTTTNGTVTLDGSDQNIEIYWIANSNSDGIVIARSTTSGDYIFTIDNVSVKEATIDNLPRVDYTDGTSSLLVEPQRTNLITYSEDFSQWNNNQLTIEPNAIISPDGTLNASKITPTTTSSVHLISTSGSTTMAMSIYAKSNGYHRFRFNSGSSGNGYASFDLNAGTVISSGGTYYTSSSIDSVGNGWYRCTLVLTSGVASVTTLAIEDNSGNVSFIGDGTSAIYIWAGQAEAGSYPTSYIKTSGSTVTRNQETYTKTGISDLINSEEGVLFLELSALSIADGNRYITLTNGSVNSYGIRILYQSASGSVFFQKYVNGTRTTNVATSSITTTDLNKLAIRYNTTNVDVWVNGIEILTNSDTNLIPSGTLNRLAFDIGDFSSNFYGKVKQLQIFKTALSDSELATLTT